MISMLIFCSLVVFGITLTITKSSIMHKTREFVKERYLASQVFSRPSFFHTWWYKMWNCPMCVGFWISLIICWVFPPMPDIWGYIGSVIAVFGMNWIWHCIENVLFTAGKYFEGKLNSRTE